MNSPDFSWKDSRRASGVFLHISSLPSETGIGNFGEGALRFAKFLKDAGFKYWQICPTGPTGFGDSPYQSFSAFAGNPYFIDLQHLHSFGLLEADELAVLQGLPRDHCDFGALYARFLPLLAKVCARALSPSGKLAEFENLYKSNFEAFCKKNADWLEPYAWYTALKSDFGGAAWHTWPEEFRFFDRFKKSARAKSKDFLSECRSVKFAQWLYDCQARRLKKTLEGLGIEVIGDMPIYVSFDSADVWRNPELFDLDEALQPNKIAGVGPDYFSPKGQLWGNPLYNWTSRKKGVYDFWRRRVARAFEFADVLRLDHFRGFADYWEVPYGDLDARAGRMLDGPGADFLSFLRGHFPEEKFIGEDLGILSDKSVLLRDAVKIPCMRVLQFAFCGGADNAYLPHNHGKNDVCYTGTHDNDTSLGWYAASPEKERDFFRRYLRVCGDAANWDLISEAMRSVCFLCVLPAQDILDLGSCARMNTPGVAQGNWRWRVTERQFAEMSARADYLSQLNTLTWRHADFSAQSAGLCGGAAGK